MLVLCGLLAVHMRREAIARLVGEPRSRGVQASCAGGLARSCHRGQQGPDQLLCQIRGSALGEDLGLLAGELSVAEDAAIMEVRQLLEASSESRAPAPAPGARASPA